MLNCNWAQESPTRIEEFSNSTAGARLSLYEVTEHGQCFPKFGPQDNIRGYIDDQVLFE